MHDSRFTISRFTTCVSVTVELGTWEFPVSFHVEKVTIRATILWGINIHRYT